MNYVNPHFFSAILESVPHRFILIQECEYLTGYEGYQPPRFSIGALNANRDPRMAHLRQLTAINVSVSSVQIPPSWLMAHQYIYIVHDHTDQFGWQYRSTWPAASPIPTAREEQWVGEYLPSVHFVRRRIWMTTIVIRNDLIRTKRLLSENIRIDNGSVRMQGELYRYEKGTLTKSWNRRRVVLFHNRIEFYSGNQKKGEISLSDCEIKMLSGEQCPGRQSAFSIRNPTGSVGILLDATDPDSRREWVLAIQYQLAMNSPDANFQPLEYAPPTGEYPDNRVLMSSDLRMLDKDGRVWLPRHFQLTPREIVCYDESDELTGRIFVEQATVSASLPASTSAESATLSSKSSGHNEFSITSASGISLTLSSENDSIRSDWMQGVRQQVQAIESQKLKQKTVPREELQESQSAIERIGQFYEESWAAPAVEGESEEYLSSIFTAPYRNHPDHHEFNADLGISLDLPSVPQSTAHNKFGSRDRLPSDSVQSSSSGNQGNAVSAMSSTLNPAGVASGTAHGTSMSDLLATTGIALPGAIRTVSTDQSSIMSGLPTPSSRIAATTSSHNISTSNIVNTVSTVNTVNSTTNNVILKSSTSWSSPPSPANSQAVSQQGLPVMTMGKYLNPRRIAINPRIILSILKTINHRFVLVLESEFRRDASPAVALNAPARFTVGGPRASKDPRNVTVSQLLEVTHRKPEILFPTGWFMLHSYIFIVQQNTDDDGWQYRSQWNTDAQVMSQTQNAGASSDEPWVDIPDANKMVRRRLWMTTVVKKDDILRAKRLLAEWIDKPRDDTIYREDVSFCQLTGDDDLQTAENWEPCVALLYHRKIEFYNGQDKRGEANLGDCELLFLPPESYNREFVLCIHYFSNNARILLHCQDRESRRRWASAIQYQLLLLSPFLSFDPLLGSPPSDILPEQRVILCGDLQVLTSSPSGHSHHPAGPEQWETVTALLCESNLTCNRRDNSLFGRLLLDSVAVYLRGREDERDFSLRISSGTSTLTAVFRAEDAESRLQWTQELKRLIESSKHKKKFAAANAINPMGSSSNSRPTSMSGSAPQSPNSSFLVSHRSKTLEEQRMLARQFCDDSWLAEEGELTSMAEEEAVLAMREKFESENHFQWPQATASSGVALGREVVATAKKGSTRALPSPQPVSRELELSPAAAHATVSQWASPATSTASIVTANNTSTTNTVTQSSTSTVSRFSSQQSTTQSASTSTLATAALKAVKSFVEDDSITDADFEGIPSSLSKFQSKPQATMSSSTNHSVRKEVNTTSTTSTTSTITNNIVEQHSETVNNQQTGSPLPSMSRIDLRNVNDVSRDDVQQSSRSSSRPSTSRSSASAIVTFPSEDVSAPFMASDGIVPSNRPPLPTASMQANQQVAVSSISSSSKVVTSSVVNSSTTNTVTNNFTSNVINSNVSNNVQEIHGVGTATSMLPISSSMSKLQALRARLHAADGSTPHQQDLPPQELNLDDLDDSDGPSSRSVSVKQETMTSSSTKSVSVVQQQMQKQVVQMESVEQQSTSAMSSSKMSSVSGERFLVPRAADDGADWDGSLVSGAASVSSRSVSSSSKVVTSSVVNSSTTNTVTNNFTSNVINSNVSNNVQEIHTATPMLPISSSMSKLQALRARLHAADGSTPHQQDLPPQELNLDDLDDSDGPSSRSVSVKQETMTSSSTKSVSVVQQQMQKQVVQANFEEVTNSSARIKHAESHHSNKLHSHSHAHSRTHSLASRDGTEADSQESASVEAKSLSPLASERSDGSRSPLPLSGRSIELSADSDRAKGDRQIPRKLNFTVNKQELGSYKTGIDEHDTNVKNMIQRFSNRPTAPLFPKKS